MSMNDRDANPLSVKYYIFRFEEIRELSGSEFFTECGYLKICGPKFKDFEVHIPRYCPDGDGQPGAGLGGALPGHRGQGHRLPAAGPRAAHHSASLPQVR